MSSEKACYTPVVVVDTTGLTEEEWLAHRRAGIGGSDAAAVLGASPFTTARDLYYDKLNIVSATDTRDNWVQLEVGHLLEDLVAKIFHVKTGYRIYQIKRMFRHPHYPFMLANVDYFVELPDGTTAILEIKTTGYNGKNYWWEGDREIVPLHYELQGRHYMAVMNIDKVYFCCLYGNSENDTIIRTISRDLDIESELIALEENFWVNHVQKQVPPPYTESGDLILDSLRRRLNEGDQSEEEIVLSESLGSSVVRYLDLQAQKSVLDEQAKAIESQMQRIKGLIAVEMGSGSRALCSVCGNEYTVTYNSVSRTGIPKDNLVRLKEQHPDVYDQFVTVSRSRRFQIKQKAREAA